MSDPFPVSVNTPSDHDVSHTSLLLRDYASLLQRLSADWTLEYRQGESLSAERAICGHITSVTALPEIYVQGDHSVS